jgi:hypothetical protein
MATPSQARVTQEIQEFLREQECETGKGLVNSEANQGVAKHPETRGDR